MSDPQTNQSAGTSKDVPPPKSFDVSPPTSTGANFSSSNCGQVQGTASGPALMPGAGLLAINGNANLSSCICGTSSNAAVNQMWVSNNPPENKVYRYCIFVNAQGPTGLGTNLWLVFTDETGDQYKLKIHDSSLEQHFLQYNSTGPGITQIAWYPTDP